MPKILITGGAGFIGSHIAAALIDQGYRVIIIDDLSTGKKENINPKAKFYKINISDPQVSNIFQTEQPDYVNHHAAQIDVRKSVEDPLFDAQVNILGSINILQNCLKYKVKKFIFASTGGAIYGEPKYLPTDENHPVQPISPYGIAKRVVEHYLQFYQLTYGLPFVSLRYGNVYGPRQDPTGEAGVVAIFTAAMLQGKTPTIFGDGENLRDYIYIDDVVNANLIAIQKTNNQIYNIGTGTGTSVNQLYQKLTNIIGFKAPPNYDDPKPGDLHQIYLDCQKAKDQINWQPHISLGQGLEKTVQFFRKKEF